MMKSPKSTSGSSVASVRSSSRRSAPSHDGQAYRMSFTTGGLFVNESVAIAGLHTPGQDWEATLAAARQSEAVSARRVASAQRVTREIVIRLQKLSAAELLLLRDGDRGDRLALLWLAVCRAYRFVGEFAIELISDRFLSFRTDLAHDDFDLFLAAKAEWSPKLAGLSDATRTKLRAVLFRILKEAEIVTPAGRIEGTVLSPRLIALLGESDPSDLRVFPGAERFAAGLKK